MRKICLIILVTLLSFHFALSQGKEYVCTPCGSACDDQVYTKPGTCGACGMTLVEKASVRFGNISIEQVCARVEANPKVVLLDVRTAGEFSGTGFRTYGHFKNAININIDELEDRLGELSKYKDEEVIVYCSHSRRSPRASHLLASNGFRNVKNMEGGVSAISNADRNPCLSKIFVGH